MTEKNETESIGYKKPPKDHQFQPGQSGNPNGRPKGVRNFKTDLRDELSETITFREGDRDIEISKQRALIKRLVASAIAGDMRAINTLMSFCGRAFGDEDDDHQQQSPEDCEIVNALAHRPPTRRRLTAGSPKTNELDHG